MSDFRPDTEGVVVDPFFFLFLRLTCSVALWGGRTPQTNNTGLCLQCLSHTGPAPVHGACSFPAHNAQALGCSTGNHPRLALGCLHFPDLSRSDSDTWVVLRGTDSFGPAFCALPRSEQLRWWGVWQAWLLHLIASLALGFLGVQLAHLLRRLLTDQNPKKS